MFFTSGARAWRGCGPGAEASPALPRPGLGQEWGLGPHGGELEPGREPGEVRSKPKKLFTLLDLCVSSLRRGHANLFYSRTRVSQIGSRIPYWDPEVPQKLKEVTLMRPIHGNL